MLFVKKRLVLILGDEHAVLALVVGGRARKAWLTLADPVEGAGDLAEALDDHPDVAVDLLVDVHEQVFREERLPKLNFLDQPKVVKRHLGAAFAGDALRAAVPQGEDKQGNRFYLFTAIPPTPALSGWIEALEKSRNGLGGIYLLPMESLDLMRELAPYRPGSAGVVWRILVSNHLSGGTRMLVSKQGRFALTRLTLPPPPDADPNDHAAALVADFKATLGYIRRMGFSADDLLDLVILTSDEIRDRLPQQWEAASVTALTPAEAAAALRLGTVGGAEQGYSDVLHAAWFAGRSKRRIELRRASAPILDLPRLAERHAPWMAILALSCGTAYAATLYSDLKELQSDVAREEAEIARLSPMIAAEKTTLATLPFTADRIRSGLAVERALNQGAADLGGQLVRIARSLGPETQVLALNFGIGAPTEAASAGRRRPRQGVAEPAAGTLEAPPFQIDLTVRLPVGLNGDAAALENARGLEQRLRDAFEGLPVSMIRPPVAVLDTQVLRGNLGQETARAREDAYTAEYRIGGGAL